MIVVGFQSASVYVASVSEWTTRWRTLWYLLARRTLQRNYTALRRKSQQISR